MRWVVAFIALTVTLVVVAIAAGASQAAPGWSRFENKTALCSVSKPGASRGATCIIKTGQLEGWSFIIGVFGVEIIKPNDVKAFNKKTTSDVEGSGIPFTGWQHRNEGVACKSLTYTVVCMIRRGGMEGWAVLIADDLVEVTNLDNVVKFRRGNPA
jgi:hypothetical protein